jgi:hypothetical protein
VTNQQLAVFRGEFLGLKILVLSCVKEMAERQGNPSAFLGGLRTRALHEIAHTNLFDVRRQHLIDFCEAAVGVIDQTGAPAEKARRSGERSQLSRVMTRGSR